MLRRLGADVTEVRLPHQLADLDGLIIPGGESTTIGKLAALDAMCSFGCYEAEELRHWIASGHGSQS